MAEAKSATVKLDWSRLLGFDQADTPPSGTPAANLRDPRLAKIGTKPGGKVGNKFGVKAGR